MDPGMRHAQYLSHRLMAQKVSGLNSTLHGSRFGAAPHTFGLGGRTFNTSNVARGGLAAGLGILAVKDAQNTYQKLKYGQIGGAMLSAAMTAGAAAGAYHMATQSNAMKQALNFTAIRLGGIAKKIGRI